MAELTDSGFVALTQAEAAALLQAAIDSAIGPQDYGTATVPTIEGGWVQGHALREAAQEERAGILIDATDPRRARGAFLDGHAAALNITRRAATSSTYLIKGVTTSGTSTLPQGVLLLDDTSDANQWTVDTTTALTTSPAYFAVTCVATGQVVLPATVTFRVVTPVVNVPTVTYASADGQAFTLGKARERDAELLARMTRAPSTRPSATVDGIRNGLLALTQPALTAASVVRTTTQTIAVYVYPAPVGAAQQQAVIDVIGYRMAAITQTAAGTGTAVTGTYTRRDGSTQSITYTVPSTQSVAVVVVLSFVAGLSATDQAEAILEARAVVAAVFGALDVGETLLWGGMYSAIFGVDGVKGLTLTLNGGTADIAPSTSTTQLALSTLAVS